MYFTGSILIHVQPSNSLLQGLALRVKKREEEESWNFLLSASATARQSPRTGQVFSILMRKEALEGRQTDGPTQIRVSNGQSEHQTDSFHEKTDVPAAEQTFRLPRSF